MTERDMLKKICANVANPAQNPLCKDVAGDYIQGNNYFLLFCESSWPPQIFL